MERAHVRAWPALETARIEGWLWRASGGGSQRANSVSTVDFTGIDPAAAIDAVEARYRALGTVARFHTFDDTQPPGLAALLEQRGYQPTEGTITLFKRPMPGPAPSDIEQRDTPWPGWIDTYTGEITPNRREVNTRILAAIPAPRMFFGHCRDGHIVATALCVIDAGCAVVECVATRAGFRRQGAANRVMRALETWAAAQGADLLGLQVVSTNIPARTLYENLGFRAGASNRFWVRDPAGYRIAGR
ncbi:GNAT family N-acetyltransferase [Rhodopila sp.]|jgi:GNAT superfamily N-acetyltransferase|uniref:GNAT family N-acetyltransferase n=1 Tax=Rhodopila sp. TaxID=2480087 RepID=UPI002C5CDDC4|nr:GNAT family N-acetyltransferase [Rhodopila sp.]HVZ09233.1 GNAT family N-acetyltransferase [Rhodopila sp.]